MSYAHSIRINKWQKKQKEMTKANKRKIIIAFATYRKRIRTHGVIDIPIPSPAEQRIGRTKSVTVSDDMWH